MSGDRETVRRVLIYRLGSLGDTVVTLPCFHLVARAFPDAERRVLTNEPIGGKAAPVEHVLGDGGFAHGYLRYPAGTRRLTSLFRLRREIRAFDPDLLVYLTETRGAAAAVRDVGFFRTCGIGRIVGAPLSSDLASYRYLPKRGLWEHEAERLARCMSPLGDVRLDSRESWDLRFTAAERARVERALAGWPGAGSFVAFSIGANKDVSDWGDARWSAVLPVLSDAAPGVGLALIGAAQDRARSAALAAHWRGPAINLCGALAPRESGLAIARARLFMGHDSGPMHLAAAVGTPTVAVFSGHSLPGVWFPYGPGHTPLHHRTKCAGCHLERCVEYGKMCITAIEPETVVKAARETLARRSAAPAGA